MAGHALATVRDREAPGSNPGPPTSFLNSRSAADHLRGDFGPGDHVAGFQVKPVSYSPGVFHQGYWCSDPSLVADG
jgi:hypothetical protein